MSITVIKEGDHLRILSSTEAIPENTPIELVRPAVEPWHAAQLESAFRDNEDWGDALSSLLLEGEKK